MALLTDPRPHNDVEILVIDNNSSDDTADLVKRLSPSFPYNIRYIFEAQQGLSFARNRAVREAKGDYLAFLDDECTVAPDWLSVLILDIDEYRPCIIGGPYFGAFLPGEKPKWFKEEYGSAEFLKYNFGRGFQDNFWAPGGNMVVRRNVFEDVMFDITFGKTGDKNLKVGEEVDFQQRFLRAHPSEKTFYEPKLIVRHFVLAEKLRLSYRARRVFASALGDPPKVDKKRLFIALAKVLSFSAFYAIVFPIRVIWRDREAYPFWQNYLYERVIPRICWHSGTIVKYVRDSRNRRATACAS